MTDEYNALAHTEDHFDADTDSEGEIEPWHPPLILSKTGKEGENLLLSDTIQDCEIMELSGNESDSESDIALWHPPLQLP